MAWIRYFRYRTYRTIMAPRGDAKPAGRGFEAVAFDPKLRVRPLRGKLRPGWYLISYRAHTGFTDSLFVPKIYPLDSVEKLPPPRQVPGNFGGIPDSMAQVQLQPDARPAAEKNTINLRAHFPGATRHLVYYDLGPDGFRFDPFDLEYPRTRLPNLGWFSIDDFTLTYLGKIHLLRYCLTQGTLRATRWRKEIRVLLGLLFGRGAGAFFRWLCHRTYRTIQPTISLTAWLTFLRSNRGVDLSHRDIVAHPKAPRIKILLRADPCRGPQFRRFIDAVINQEYPHWELFIWPLAGSTGLTPLDRWYCRDARIQSVPADRAPVLTQSSDHFWCVMDTDHLLDGSALMQFAKSIVNQSPDIVYADDAELSWDSERVIRINLRPAFSLDHFLANAFTGLPTLVRASKLTPSPGPWTDLDAYQISEALVLDALARCEKVLHIPDVLHSHIRDRNQTPHKRLGAESINDYLQKMGMADAKVEPVADSNVCRVRFARPSKGKTAIIIPTKNQCGLLKNTIRSIQQTVPAHLFDLIVVDHDSDDPETRVYLNQLRDNAYVVRATGAFNFSRLNNLAVRQLSTTYDSLLFMNNDVEALQSGWLESMRDKLSRPDVGVIGAVLLYPSQSDDAQAKDRARPWAGHHIQHAGVVLGIGVAEHFMKLERFADAYRPNPSDTGAQPALVTRGFSAVTAACLMIKPAVFEAAGGFDENLKVAFGDVDLCLRVSNMGYRILCDGEAVLIHHESASRGKGEDLDPHLEDSAEFERRYGLDIRLGDPFHHPLLAQNNFRYRPMRSPVRAIDPVYRVVTHPVSRPHD